MSSMYSDEANLTFQQRKWLKLTWTICTKTCRAFAASPVSLYRHQRGVIWINFVDDFWQVAMAHGDSHNVELTNSREQVAAMHTTITTTPAFCFKFNWVTNSPVDQSVELEQILVLILNHIRSTVDRISAGLFLLIDSGLTIPVISVDNMSSLMSAHCHQCGWLLYVLNLLSA